MGGTWQPCLNWRQQFDMGGGGHTVAIFPLRFWQCKEWRLQAYGRLNQCFLRHFFLGFLNTRNSHVRSYNFYDASHISAFWDDAGVLISAWIHVWPVYKNNDLLLDLIMFLKDPVLKTHFESTVLQLFCPFVYFSVSWGSAKMWNFPSVMSPPRRIYWGEPRKVQSTSRHTG